MPNVYSVITGSTPSILTAHLLANAPPSPYRLDQFEQANYYGYKPVPLTGLITSGGQNNALETLTGTCVFNFNGPSPYYHPAGMYVQAVVDGVPYLVYLFLASMARNIVMIQGSTTFTITITAENLQRGRN